MIRVIVESPYAGDVIENIRYLRAAIRDCIMRGETPYASHALLTQEGVLDDNEPSERELGINAGFAWREAAEKTVFYVDRGVSRGMRAGLSNAMAAGHRIELRSMAAWNGPESDVAIAELQRLQSAGVVP